jgi:catechol 2,3-dioxygenase-like lactoylglutathione lyase family enzyme
VLEGRPFVGFLLITDAARAKEFYCELLGLPLRDEDDFAVVVDAGGTTLRLALVAEVPEPAGTNAGWLVDDINSAVRTLAAAGVTFERFPGMDQDTDGVWRPFPGAAGVAWFRDPDGNRLSLTQAA